MAQYLPTREDIRNFNKIPCMKDSLLRGLGGGILAGIVWGVTSRQPKRVGDGLFLGFIVTSSTSWVICRHNDRVRREAIQRMMLAQSKAPDVETMEAIGKEEAKQAEERSSK